ncbi:MAG: glycoside hydrolase family protein [Clostridia bacterium]|nr:glycoside hydrolase family protein [Clostridia bacterium]
MKHIDESIVPQSLSYVMSVNEAFDIMNESDNLTHVSDQMIELLKKYETQYSRYLIKDVQGNIIGIKPHDVGDGGITVGFGHFISNKELRTDAEAYKLAQRNLSVEEATAIMKTDLERFEKQILNLMKRNEIYLVQHEFDALVLQAYNYGNVNYLTDLLKSGNRDRNKWIEVITERMEVNKGKFYNGLMNRRYQEMDLFLYGDYNGGPDVIKYP